MGISPMMIIFGHEPAMPLQIVDISEVPTYAPVKENQEIYWRLSRQYLSYQTTYITRHPITSSGLRYDKHIIFIDNTTGGRGKVMKNIMKNTHCKGGYLSPNVKAPIML